MLKWFLKRKLDAFERAYSYDISYARDILDADPAALMAFWKVVGMAGYRKGVPRDPWFAAGLAGVLAEDCGPCTQLGVDRAAEAGVPPEVVRAVVAGDVGAMPDDVALAFRFARASLDRDPEADALREEVVRRWGKRGLVSLAFAVTAARMFPTLKSALGHAKSCTRIRVAGEYVKPATAGAH
jgi:hypothetical protein